MRISLIITNLATGGAETMLFKLLKHIDRTRFTPSVISLMGLGDMGPRIEALGIPVHALGMSRGVLPSPVALWRLWRLLLRIQPDVVHTWMYHADLVGGVVARLAGCSHVAWCIRNSNLSLTEKKLSTVWAVKLCALLSRVVPQTILSCSHRAHDVHVALGYPLHKLQVIPNGFDLVRFVPDVASRAGVRAELGLPPHALLVGLVARFDPQKNHIGFLDSAALVQARMPQVNFVLVGQGIDSSNVALTDAIAQKRLQGRMHLLGRRSDIPRLMASFDVLALSSSHGEAFPNVLGEAMACGVPCVVTDVGDSAEIVGNTGRVVAAGNMAGLADGLLELLGMTDAHRANLGEQARAKVATEYEIGHVADRYMAFYERLLAAKS